MLGVMVAGSVLGGCSLFISYNSCVHDTHHAMNQYYTMAYDVAVASRGPQYRIVKDTAFPAPAMSHHTESSKGHPHIVRATHASRT